MISSTVKWFLLFSLLPLATITSAQTSETHDTEHITIENVGDYRPESKPDLTKVAQSIIDATNEFRKQEDLETLTSNENLKKTAQDFADYMARTDRYGHTADDRKPSERAAAHEYEYCIVAENIAYFFQTRGFGTEELSKTAFEGWKNSPGHRENMLRPEVTETGVALSQSETTGVYYAVQLFGRPRSQAFQFEVVNRTEQEIKYRVGKREFTSPMRTKRRHRVCLPSKIVFLNGEKTVAEYQTDSPVRYLVQPSDGELKISAKTAIFEEN